MLRRLLIAVSAALGIAASAVAAELPGSDIRAAQAAFTMAVACDWRDDTACTLDALALARQLDPRCALCAWLEARVLSEDPEREEAAWRSLAEARRLAVPEGGLALALTRAFGLRFGIGPAAEAHAMAAVAARYPQYATVQVWAARALQDYEPATAQWLAEMVLGERPAPRGRPGAAAQPVDPRHPGALRVLGRVVPPG